ncbi:PR15B phosphatase, partial [Serilophus lunatus]|nr:PR15B phosphatase [Serilophus lunatus]
PAKAPPPAVLLPRPGSWAGPPPEKQAQGEAEPPAGLWGAGLVRSGLGSLPVDWYVLGMEQSKSHLPQPLRAEALPEVEFLRSKRLAFLQRWHLPVPEPDHGYHSLEEEQQQHGGVRRETGELEQPEDARRQPGGVPVEQEGIRAAAEEGGALAGGDGEDSDTEQNRPVSSRPVCANKLIDYIIGGVSSGEESEDEEDWDDEEDDDGFDSEELPSDSDACSQDGERLHLWNSFYSLDPYNPQNFTATIQTSSSEPGKDMSDVEEEEEEEDSWAESSSGSPGSSDEEDEWDCGSVDEAENLKLWNSFCTTDDPYNPLNFTAAFQTAEKKGRGEERSSPGSAEPFAVCRGQLERHNCGLSDLGQRGILAGEKGPSSKRKKVTFLDTVTEYYISSEEDRKGPWEELARDGCRFHKRIQQTEEAIGYCFSTEHRQRVFHRLQKTCPEGVELF